MKTIFTLIYVALATAPAFAAPLIPTTDGMSWSYILTQEAGEGFRFSTGKADADGKVRVPVVYRLSGTQNVDGKDLLKFEMHREGMITNTDLVTVNERGIAVCARIDQAGKMIKLDPPQTMVATPIKTGARWDFDSVVAGAEVHQHYAVIDEEDVDLAAGKFRAFKIHGEQTSPEAMTIDRWFVNGIGIVKDVTTTRTVADELVRRITLELKERPKVAPRPEVKRPATTKKLAASVGKEASGAAATNFGADTQKICARWQGSGLRKDAKIRAVWVAENIGDAAPPDYAIDEATTAVSSANAHGVFTFARPEEGWAPGDYRVEFYVDDALTETAKLKIAK